MGAAKKWVKELADEALDSAFDDLDNESSTVIQGLSQKASSDEKTELLPSSKKKISLRSKPQKKESVKIQNPVLTIDLLSESQKKVLTSKYLSVAEEKIQKLERENEKVLKENDEIRSMAEVLKERAEGYRSRINTLERQSQESIDKITWSYNRAKEEKDKLENEVIALGSKAKEYEKRSEATFLSVGRREKELEHRLEIMKNENIGLKKIKDDQILALKGKMESLQKDIENYKAKYQEHINMVKNRESILQRVLRTLRITQSIIEGGEFTDDEES